MSVIDGIRTVVRASDNKDRTVKDKYAKYKWLIFSDEDYDGYKRSAVIKSFLIAAAIMILSLSLYSLQVRSSAEPEINAVLQRDTEEKTAELELSLEYGGQRVEKDMDITVLAKKMDKGTAGKLFDECEQWLSEHLAQNLDFPEKAPNGVEITWEETDFTYLGMAEPQEKLFIARLSTGEYNRLAEFKIMLDPNDEKYRQSLEALATKLEDSLSEDGSGDDLILPESMNGAELKWSVRSKEAPTAIIAVGLLVSAAVILSRRDTEKRQLENRKRNFERQIPELCFQLTLYLNSGLVAENAFSRIIQQNESSYEPLYRALRDIRTKADSANHSLISEFYNYARTTGSRDLLRLAALCYEHAARGSELSEKLDQESRIMQSKRIRDARTGVKTAETKLCFPLIMLLAALILITVMPSLLTMR